MNTDIETNRMNQDWMILADGAQVTNGKLYVLGGGWDRINITKAPPVSHTMAIALGIRVPWNQANLRHQFQLSIVDAEGTTKLMEANGEFEVGRAVGSIPGQDQRFQFAATFTVQLTKEGEYTVVIDVDGEQLGRTPFYVALAPALRAQMEQQRKKGT